MLLHLFAILIVFAQTPVLHPNAPDNAKPPVVAFDFLLPGSAPGHYSLAVDSAGRAAYLSEDVPTQGTKPSEPYTIKFVISESTRARIFQLANQLNHFQGDFEYHGGRIANMGAKTFSWSDGVKESKTTFNYSTDPHLQELTRLFQQISATMEHGRHIEYLRRFDKLGLDAELKALEENAAHDQLAELQLLQPLLAKIANDYSAMNITRRRAQKLLGVIKPAQQLAPQ